MNSAIKPQQPKQLILRSSPSWSIGCDYTSIAKVPTRVPQNIQSHAAISIRADRRMIANRFCDSLLREAEGFEHGAEDGLIIGPVVSGHGLHDDDIGQTIVLRQHEPAMRTIAGIREERTQRVFATELDGCRFAIGDFGEGASRLAPKILQAAALRPRRDDDDKLCTFGPLSLCQVGTTDSE